MVRNLSIVLLAAVVLGLPFALRPPRETGRWQPGDPVLVVISPHNEAIRYEFGRAFSLWHERHYGRPARVDWRNIGGTTEIMRYLAAEYAAAFRAWWRAQGREWPAGGGDALLDPKFKADAPPPEAANDPAARARWEALKAARAAFRAVDDPAAFSCQVDVFFGGGSYDHGKAFAQGLTVPLWPADAPLPAALLAPDGTALIPEALSGEIWRTPSFCAAALSAFGICYNADRLRDLGLPAPAHWEDLADPRYFRQLGLADPTKSGSIAKAFEMIVQEQCARAVRDAGFNDAQVARFEAQIAAARRPPGELPAEVPAAYQTAVESGWLNGLRLIQRLGANARYFTDSASKVPIDVSQGDAAAGVAIDFYGRYQAQVSAAPGGRPRMVYVTPAGGSSVSADPIARLRGAPHRELAERFIAFVLGPDGQRLWNYAPGAPGGPAKFALRRLPARRDFYPAAAPELQTAYEEHRRHTVDALGDPAVNPYELARQFTYRPRWTAGHFGILRELVRAMCLDSAEELQAAWRAIGERGGPAAQPEAMALLQRLPERPEPLTWRAALDIGQRHHPLDYMREWTLCFRENYRAARAMAEASAAPGAARTPPR